MLIIPDVHGRSFWEQPVADAIGKEQIVFLGDYLDPYQYEGINDAVAFYQLQQIASIKREHPDDVTLLLGNHDLHYLCIRMEGGRMDYLNMRRNEKFFTENADLFSITEEAKIGGRKYLFSHAGVLRGWVERYRNDLFKAMEIERAPSYLNDLWHDEDRRDLLLLALSDIPLSRWGRSLYGSPAWSDVDDMSKDTEEIPGYYQIFGHSQQEYRPVIEKTFACLDCRRAFKLNENGEFECLTGFI